MEFHFFSSTFAGFAFSSQLQLERKRSDGQQPCCNNDGVRRGRAAKGLRRSLESEKVSEDLWWSAEGENVESVKVCGGLGRSKWSVKVCGVEICGG